MDEQAKLVLYRQLEEMSSLNRKQGAEPLISEQEFLALTDKDALKYTFEYRDEQTDFGEDIYYIEMPDMNLEGQDLQDVQISRFMLSRTEDGERVSSNINLRNTGITINLTDIGISEQTQDDIGLATQTIDFSNVDFHGCELYGILNDEYQEQITSKAKNKFVVLGRENLDERYVQRRQEHHLTPEQKKISDRAYERLIAGQTLEGMRGVNEHIDLTDYDFSDVQEYSNIALEYVRRDIELTDTGISSEKFEQQVFQQRLQNFSILGEAEQKKIVFSAYERGDLSYIEQIWQELKTSIKEYVLELMYQKGNKEFIEQHWGSIGWQSKSKLVKTAYEKGNLEFVEHHWEGSCWELKNELLKSEYEKDNIAFIERHWESLGEMLKDQIIMSEYEKGNMKFIERHYFGGKREQIIMSEYEKGNLEFVARHLETIGFRTIEEKIIKLEYEKGNLEFVARCWDSARSVLREQIIMSEYEKGNLEFVKQHLSGGYWHLQKQIVMAEYEKGNMEFIEQHWERMARDFKYPIIESEYEKGNMVFVKQHLDFLDRELATPIIMVEYEKGNMEFIEQYWMCLDSNSQNEIIKSEYEKGNIEFIGQHWEDINRDLQGLLVKSECEKGRMDFVKEHFDCLYSAQKSQIIKKAYKKGNIEFVCQKLYEVSETTKNEILDLEYKKGIESFTKYYWNALASYDKTKTVKSEYEKGNMTFVEQCFDEIDRDLRFVIAKLECKKGNYKYIKKRIEEENREKVLHGQKEVSCSGRTLAREMLKDVIDKDFIIGLIKAGSGLNYIAYGNRDGRSPEYIPTLYQALKIEDDDVRKEIVSEMLKAGVNIDTKYVKSNYSYTGVKRIEERCLDVNGGELRQIMKELGMEVPGESHRIVSSREGFPRREQPARDNKVLVSDFLTHEVGLTDEQISSLQQSYQAIGRDVYSLSTERLGMQKEILDYCGGTKQVFTRDTKVLAQDPQLMYARLMLYRELGVAVLPDRLYTTIGISKKGFAKKFGAHILEKGNMEDGDYEYKLKQELLKRYPMPQTREELKKVLEEIRKQEIGG